MTSIPLGGILAVMNKIQNRLKRIEGQLRGLQKSVETSEDCEKTIIQFMAAKSALENCFSALLNENLNKCLKNGDSNQVEKILKLIIKK